MSNSAIPWTAALQASLSFTISRSLLKLMSIESMMPSNPHPVALFSSCPQSFSASGSFLMSRLFTSDGRSIGASALASVLPMNIQGWFPLGLTSLISLLSKSLLQHHNLKASVLWCSASFMVQLSHPYMTTGKAIWIFVGKVMSLLFNMLYKLVIAFLPRSKSSEMEFLWLDYEGKGSFSRKYN